MVFLAMERGFFPVVPNKKEIGSLWLVGLTNQVICYINFTYFNIFIAV
jgi:hypothetical protein